MAAAAAAASDRRKGKDNWAIDGKRSTRQTDILKDWRKEKRGINRLGPIEEEKALSSAAAVTH